MKSKGPSVVAKIGIVVVVLCTISVSEAKNTGRAAQTYQPNWLTKRLPSAIRARLGYRWLVKAHPEVIPSPSKPVLTERLPVGGRAQSALICSIIAAERRAVLVDRALRSKIAVPQETIRWVKGSIDRHWRALSQSHRLPPNSARLSRLARSVARLGSALQK